MRQLLLLFSAVFLFSFFFAGLSYGSDEGGSKSPGSSLRHLFAPKEGTVQALEAIKAAFNEGDLAKVKRTTEAARLNLRSTLKQMEKEVAEAEKTQQVYSRSYDESVEQEQVRVQEVTKKMQVAIAQIHANNAAKRTKFREREDATKQKVLQLKKAQDALKEGDNYLGSLSEALSQREAAVSAAGEKQNTLLRKLLNEGAPQTAWFSTVNSTPASSEEQSPRSVSPVPVIPRETPDRSAAAIEPPTLIDPEVEGQYDNDNPSHSRQEEADASLNRDENQSQPANDMSRPSQAAMTLSGHVNKGPPGRESI